MSDSISVRVRTDSVNECCALSRSGVLALGRPLPFGHQDPEFSASEAFLASIGADLGANVFRGFRREGHQVYSLEVLVVGHLVDTLVAYGVVGEAGTPRFEKITIVIYLATSASDERARELAQTGTHRSVTYQTVRLAASAECRIEVL